MLIKTTLLINLALIVLLKPLSLILVDNCASFVGLLLLLFFKFHVDRELYKSFLFDIGFDWLQNSKNHGYGALISSTLGFCEDCRKYSCANRASSCFECFTSTDKYRINRACDKSVAKLCRNNNLLKEKIRSHHKFSSAILSKSQETVLT